jgi:hypothetical protein
MVFIVMGTSKNGNPLSRRARGFLELPLGF